VDVTNTADPMDCAGDTFTVAANTTTPIQCAGTVQVRFLRDGAAVACAGRTQDVDGWGDTLSCDTTHPVVGGTYATEARCSDDLACVFASAARTIAPQTGVPSGMPEGLLRVSKTAGCPGPGDVLLSWNDSGLVPPTFVVFRNEDDTLDVVADRRADVDGTAYTDAGVACDGGGTPWRGAAVYFYQFRLRNACTGDPL
jgi:hypothetical protein